MDTAALYCIHDKSALEELYEKAYLRNTSQYDANTSMLATIRHEALYAAYILSEGLNYNVEEKPKFKIKTLLDLPESLELYNDSLFELVKIEDQTLPYGVCLLNKWMGLDFPLLQTVVTKNVTQEISRLIFKNCENSTKDFNYKISELERKLFFFISVTNHRPSVNIEQMINMVKIDTQELFNKVPSNNPHLGFHINDALVDRCIEEMDHDEELYKLFKSGSRFSKSQLARSAINIGFLADDQNLVDQHPINTSLLQGMNPQEFFMSSFGARKGISDKAKVTPQSGFMERTLVMAMSPIEISEDDCGCISGINTVIQSKKHAESIIGKYYKCIDDNINIWTEIKSMKHAKDLINKQIELRSPMTCSTKDFRICKKCFGTKEIRTKYIGITAAQSAIERLTQLIMRSSTSVGRSLNIAICWNILRDFGTM